VDDFIGDPYTNPSQQEDVPIFNDTAGNRVLQPLEGVPATISDVPAELVDDLIVCNYPHQSRRLGLYYKTFYGRNLWISVMS
jgi:hypothetical protein